MIFLLDVNVLIALIDPRHVAHDDAHAWCDRAGRNAWATCPMTENGLVRIVGSKTYPNSPGSPGAVAGMLSRLRALSGHHFWPDDLSLVDAAHVDAARLATASQVTDTYLLALAKAHDGRLATFDRRLSTAAVQGGAATLHVIAPSGP